MLPPSEPFNTPYIGAWFGSGKLIVTPNTQCNVKLRMDGQSSNANQIRISETELACSNGETYHLTSRTFIINGDRTIEDGAIVGEAYQPYQNPFGPLPDSGYRSFSYSIEIPGFGVGPYIMKLGVYPQNTFEDDPRPALFLDISLHTEKGNFVGFTALLKPQPGVDKSGEDPENFH